MRIKDKYKKFQDDKFVVKMISRSVFSTMHLEEQGLPMKKVISIVSKVHKDNKK